MDREAPHEIQPGQICFQPAVGTTLLCLDLGRWFGELECLEPCLSACSWGCPTKLAFPFKDKHVGTRNQSRQLGKVRGLGLLRGKVALGSLSYFIQP